MADKVWVEFKIDGNLTNPTSIVLADSGNTYGIRNSSTLTVVVASGTAVTHEATGRYEYDCSALSKSAAYEGYWKIVYGGDTEYVYFTIASETAANTLSAIRIELASRLGDYFVNVPKPVYDNAINEAIRAAYPELYQKATYTSIVTTANQVTYAIPGDYIRVDAVLVARTDTTKPYAHLTAWDADVEFGGGGNVRLKKTFPAGRPARIYGGTKYPTLTADSDTTELDTNYIYPAALARLHGWCSNDDRYNWQEEQAKAQYFRALANEQKIALQREQGAIYPLRSPTGVDSAPLLSIYEMPPKEEKKGRG